MAQIAFLEYFSDRSRSIRRIKLDPLPFRIGRGSGAHLLIPSQEVSKNHSEIYWEAGAFGIRDLGSTNGTFLNRQRISQGILKNDDLIHVAHEEFRFLAMPALAYSVTDSVLTQPVQGAMPTSILQGSQYLQEMLAEEWGRV